MKFISKNGRVIPIDPERVNKVYNKAGREALVNAGALYYFMNRNKK